MIGIIKIIIAAILSFWALKQFDLEGIIRFIIFFGIYIAVSLLVEILKKWYIRSKIGQKRK